MRTTLTNVVTIYSAIYVQQNGIVIRFSHLKIQSDTFKTIGYVSYTNLSCIQQNGLWSLTFDLFSGWFTQEMTDKVPELVC